MTQPARNLRVRRTQKLLREALIELIEERGFEALTVGEITERAMVSRAAFYRNYKDKYDLVEQIFAEAMSAMLSAVGELGSEHPPEMWVKFFEHIAEYERLYRALLGRKGSPWFVMKMRAELAGLVKERGHPPQHPQQMHPSNAAGHPVDTFADEFVPDLVSTMFVEVITWWLEQGRHYTPKEIATRSALLAAALFKEVSTWQ
jgi:AcrR family transcriptional regulator